MDTILKDNERTFGVEIEFIVEYGKDIDELIGFLEVLGIDCEQEIYNHNTKKHWKIVTDGSVREMGCNGYELVSPPLKGKDGIDQIAAVCLALSKFGARINKTCGLHIHHDVKDYKDKNFKYLVNFYAKAEKQMDSIMSPSRRNNIFCRSLNYEYYNKDYPFAGDRYYKVNVQSYYKYGTVEFRHHQGTLNAEKIINWIDLTQRMVLRAKKKVTEYKGHSLTWFDVKQALGLVHNAGNREMVLANFYENRMAA